MNIGLPPTCHFNGTTKSYLFAWYLNGRHVVGLRAPHGVVLAYARFLHDPTACLFCNRVPLAVLTCGVVAIASLIIFP